MSTILANAALVVGLGLLGVALGVASWEVAVSGLACVVTWQTVRLMRDEDDDEDEAVKA